MQGVTVSGHAQQEALEGRGSGQGEEEAQGQPPGFLEPPCCWLSMERHGKCKRKNQCEQ